MAPFSSLFDIVTHHHHRRGVRDEMDPSSLSLDSSCSSSDSTFAVEPMKKPLSEQIRSKHKVSFYNSVHVQFIESVDQYSDEEKASSWYTRQDFENMKKDRRATVKVMEDGNVKVDDGQHYFRGVENKTRKGSQCKQWNMVEAAMVVFDEQQMNHTYHRKEDATQAIANAYRSVVAHTREAAAERGLHDQRAALESWTSAVVLSNESLNTPAPRRLSCRAA
jgi:hypothetical protein